MEPTWKKLFDSGSSVNISFPWLCQRPETEEPKQREGLPRLGVGYCGACGEVKWSGTAGSRWYSRTSHALPTGTSPSSPSLFQRCKSTFPSFLQSPHLQMCWVGFQASAHGLMRYPGPRYYNVSQV